MDVFDPVAEEDHERVLSGFDQVSGLKTIVAIHSTDPGPAEGGTRLFSPRKEQGTTWSG